MSEKITARIAPEGSLDLVSQHEVKLLMDKGQKGLYKLFRQCALAVLNCGNESDDPEAMLSENANFDIELIGQARGIKLEVMNAPGSAFVDGQMIKGIQSHLYAVLRDILYTGNVMSHNAIFNLENGDGITNFIFHLLRNAGVLVPRRYPNLVVCWGGHSISRDEYDYTKVVGHSLGLRGMDICTGCGPGAMKGPMKGAAIAHAKQRIRSGRYVGVSEPGIIAAESPNPIVNELVILPDIEKRLEAFVRMGHGIVVFPGGVGTAEEILYILGVLTNPANDHLPFPLIFTGSKDNEEYFGQIDEFIGLTLGKTAQKRYQIIIDDPELVALNMKKGLQDVTYYRKTTSDAYYYNWNLKIAPEFQRPFMPTHDTMRSLKLHYDQPIHELAANLRCAFSGIVAGNVKEEGVRQIAQHGPFEISGNPDLIKPFNALLTSFVKQGRMKLPGTEYVPSYRVV
ncbi:LOG family protein [Hahella sp. CCB-MM4]|uniref:nucleotide 5'-monophosphate nucleosidase PpnN n=1 Tax=Hahella sp. (strain CCB-MM4) TaxID=1926491 RepID=UPI000B9B8C0D|nr:nucleotide 5'-monophosphate nucleosidase PpnN [Hahella sp. CCB-MM4]OZG75096.1 LOG family protein [Hahella sp. CCB-MM4]